MARRKSNIHPRTRAEVDAVVGSSPSGSYLFFGTTTGQNQTASVQVASGTIALGSVGAFTSAEVESLTAAGIVLVSNSVLIDGMDVNSLAEFSELTPAARSAAIALIQAETGGGGGGGTVDSVSAGDSTITVAGTGTNPTVKVTPGTFDASGAAAAIKGLPLGLGGSTSATRFVGGTASVAPTTGTFLKGDFVVTQTGAIYVCTTAGSPGTWTQISGGGGGGAVSSVFTRTGAVTATSGDYTVSQVTGAAPLASPALSGTPTVPTAALGTSTTQAASTAFVIGQAATATPIIDGTAAVGTSTTYARADHIHPIDTSRAAVTALPPAGTSSPIIDGTAAAGSSSSFSRQDHIHPTDTTRAPLIPRINTITSSATPAINVGTTDEFTITALAAVITSMTSGLTGTPIDGQQLIIRIKDNGTARAITWGTSFASSGVATLLATTVISKTHTIGLRYDAAAAKWVCLAVDATGY